MDRLNAHAPKALALLRIMTGLLFLEHGTAKLLGFPYSKQMFIGFEPSLMGVGGALELIGGALIALGLFTRPTAFVLSGEMAVAYFAFHQPQGFFPALNMGDASILFCLVFLYLVFAGPGAFSLDAVNWVRRAKPSPRRRRR